MIEDIRSNWTKEEIETIYHMPLLDLIHQAGRVHRRYHQGSEVQVCSLISIKTGGCSEDCKYCPQSSRYQTNVTAQPLMQHDEVLQKAKYAIDKGATRICLGAAWREVRDSKQFEQVIDIVKSITAMGVEVCCTLGMLQEHQAKKLAEAGLYAYNHNLDTSKEYYSTIITSRTYEDRLKTLDVVEKANISVCCGGIIGMGEKIEDRLGLIHTLATRDPHPESVPINRLVRVKGTPLMDEPSVPIWDMIRMVSLARITMPKAMVRLSAGRLEMSFEQQALCFLAGVNSIHAGEVLLTTPNPKFDTDHEMFELFGLTKRPAFEARKSLECV
jgi:biotin synthase